MLTADEKKIFSDYKKAFETFRKDNKIIELDTNFGKKLDYFFFRLEDSLPVYGYTIPPYRVSNVVIIFTTRGEGERVIGKIRAPMKTNSLVIIPSQTIQTGSHSVDTKGFLLGFNLNFFLQERFPRHHLFKLDLFRNDLKPYTQVNASQARTLTSIFNTLFEERDQKWVNKDEMIALKILEMILICERLFKRHEKLKKKAWSPVYVQYIDLIQLHYKEHHSTSYYAKLLHIHPNVLNSLCRRHLDQSAKQTIDAKLVKEAEDLLFHTSLTVKEIAYELGFSSATHFFRFFKRHTGSSPQTIRQKHLNVS
ncbi:MAG TPA: helix-turn-helix domain-containing protein [Puia sp.]|nr:helix-turn-helix domain-containing protein [Puia sp.]